MLLSSFSVSRPVGNDFEAWAKGIAQIYQAARPKIGVNVAWPIINGTRALQLHTEDNTMIYIKVVYDIQPPATLDFSLPKDHWPEHRLKVQSCIASLRLTAAG
jgi:hypothetical protein